MRPPAAIVSRLNPAVSAAADPPGIEALSSFQELCELEPQWSSLWDADLGATPFQSPGWLIPWWEQFGNDSLLTLTARSGDGSLAGLLPLYVHTDPATGRRFALPLGVGTSDYLDGIFGAGAARTADAFVDHL